MTRAILAAAVVICIVYGSVKADETAPAQPASVPRFVLQPGPDITLVAGEQIELSVFSTRDQRAVDPAKVIWSVNGQERGKIDPALGSLTLASDAAHGGTVTFKAPASIPGNKGVTISATVFQSGSVATLKSTITLADSSNWFSIEGDPGIGHEPVSILPDPQVSPTAGIMKIGLARGDYVVQVDGTMKSKPNFSADILLSLGRSGQPGTYVWKLSKGQPHITASVAILDEKKATNSRNYVSFTDIGGALEGSTTILPASPSDPPELVKGYFGGQLRWLERGSDGNFISHYVTVHGHFAVPATK